MSRPLRILLASLIGAGTALVGIGHARATVPEATLRPGQAAFWSGPFIASAHVNSSQLCDTQGPCYSYAINVLPGRAKQLRVAAAWHSDRDSYELQLIDPTGAVVADEQSSLSASWAEEVFAPNPRPGMWTARMIPQNVTNSQFRMRARLDLPETPPAARQLLLPNLQVNPPWDVSFTGPVPPYGIATANVGGQSLWSCSPDETALHGSTRCLRFSTGPENTGSGPYEARFDLRQGTISAPNESNLTGPGILTGVVTQRIYRSDGTHVDRNAGRWQFHPAHAHYHVQNMLSYKLYAVKDAATGKVAQVGTGAKASFCTFNIAMINWTTFTSAPSQWRDLSVCYPPAGSTEVDMGISPGWSDVYTWDLADQYVDFSAGGEGEYVIQVEVNPGHTILTSNPNDNYGYALVKVEGDRVQMIERGQGTSPWDPHKVVLDPMGP